MRLTLLWIVTKKNLIAEFHSMFIGAYDWKQINAIEFEVLFVDTLLWR